MVASELIFVAGWLVASFATGGIADARAGGPQPVSWQAVADAARTATPANAAAVTAAPAAPPPGGPTVIDVAAPGPAPAADDIAPGDEARARPAARAFRRSGKGLLLELGAGSAVAVGSGLLIDHPPRWLSLSGPAGLLTAITAISVMATGAAAAVGVTAYATDGPSGSPVHDVVGLGLGALLGFGVAAGAVDSAVGTTSPTPSSALVLLGVPLGAVVGYNLVSDDDARLPGASTRVARKLSLCLLFGGNTLGGAGLDLGFQLSDRVAVALQGLDGDGGGAEASARIRGDLLAAHRSALYLSTGLHMTTGISRATEMALRTSAAAAVGALGALGVEFRADSGIMVAAELSAVYEPGATTVTNTGKGPFYPGGAFMLGYAR